MKSKNSIVFVVFSLVLVIGLLQTYYFFREYFADKHDYVAKVDSLKEQIEREHLKTSLAVNQLWDFQQSVAQLLPTGRRASPKNIQEFRLAELAQSLRKPASVDDTVTSSMLMEKGRQQFREKHYAKAISLFQDTIRKYPTSAQVIEAHFLLGESFFQAGRSDECLDVVYEMLNQFPDNEMTGYLLLRNAQILQSRKRTDEASEVFRLVSVQFAANKSLREQSRKLASENL